MDSLNTPRLQAGLGRVKEVYREGDNISTLLLARVVNVNHKYNTVDVETIGTFSGDTLAGSTEADGRFSAKLPIQFGGTNYKGKAYGQTMPVENGNMVLIGFINGRKKAPIVLSIYADEETATKLNQAQMNSSSSDSDAVKANTNQAYTLHPSLTYENIDGLGNRTVSFTGKSFLVMSQEDKRVANLSDSMYGVLYESQRSSYYSDGELIEPISEKAPIVLYKHQGIKTDSGAVDNHVFMAFVDRDGTMRLSETEKGANWKTYFEMRPDKSIGMYQMTDSSTAGMGKEGSHIAITEEGIVSLRSGDNLWELKDSRILNNGKDAVAQALEEEMRAVNKVLDLVRKANDLDRWYNKFPKMIDDFVEANGKDDPRLGYSNRLEIQEYYSDIQENKDTYLMYAKQYSVSSTDFENAFKSLQAYVDSKSFFGNTPYIQIIPSETKEKFMTAFKKCSEMLYKIIDKGTQNMSGYQLGIYDVHAGIRQTEKDVELYAGDFRVLEDRVVSNEASLKVQADKIEQKVSKVEIPNLIKENVRIGGANYFYDKQVVSLGLSTESKKVIDGDQYLGWFLAVKPGDVLSIQRWSTPNNQFSYVFTKDVPQKGMEYFGGNFNTLEANKLKYEGIEVPEEAQFFFLYLSSNAYKETLPKIKVEFGNVATDYTEPDVATKEEMRLVKESVGDLVVKADEVTASVETVIKGLGENSEILSRTVANVSVLEGKVEAKVDSDGVINAINLDKTGAKIDVQHVDIVIGGENLLDDTEKEVGGSENPLMRANWDIAPAIREYGYKRPYTISFVAKTRTNSRIMVSTTGDAFGIGSKVFETSSDRQTFSYVFYPEPLANKDTGKSILTFVGDGPDVYPVVSYVSFKLGNVDVSWTPSANDRAKETLTVIQNETIKTVGNALEQLNRSPINLFRGFPYNQKLNVRTNNEQRYTYPFAEKGTLIKVEPHTTYSFSWDYNYFSSNYGEDKLMVSVGSASETVPFKDYYFTNRLKDKEMTFEVLNVDPEYPYFGIRFSEVNNAVDTTNVDYFSLMLTKSNKPLDWAPNPNDLSDLAKQAEVDIDRALATLDDIAKDGKLTPGEKKIVAKEWATIQGEYPNIKNQAVKYAYNVAQLQTVYGNLDTYLTPLLADMTATTNVEPTEFHNKFKDYYTMKLNILNGISNQLNGKLSDVSAAAEEAQRDADAANRELADISSDNKLTPAEKLVLKKDWDTIVNEFPNLYAQGALYTVSVSELKNAYDVLYAMVPPLLKDMNATTDIDGETFRHNFVVYYGRKVSFLNTIYGSLQTNINDQINKTNQAITRVNGEIDDMAKDGKLTPVEKKLLQKEYKLIIDEQSELKKQLAQYNVDYSKVQTALTALSTYVDPLFAVMDQTSNVDGTKLKQVFNDYYNAKLTSLNAVANTINGYVTAAYNLADKAQKAAVDAKNNADKANNSISDMASDGKLTPVEKKKLATEWATIQGEFAGIKAQGTQYGVALGNYQNAYATLSSYVPDLLADMSATSDIDPTTFRTNFKLYYNYKVDVTARVADVIQGNLNATNGLLAQAQTDATNAKNQAGIANSAIADMANDGKLTPVEKKRVAAEWEAIQSELPLLKAQAGRYAVNVTTYQAKYDALNTYITPLLQNMTATSTITASAFKSTFKGYYDAKVTLMNNISDVIKGDVTAVNNELATAKKQVEAANKSLDDLLNVNNLTPAFKASTSKEIDGFKAEFVTIKAQAAKYSVSMTTYQNAYDSLISYITPLLEDMTVTTPIDIVDYSTKFKNYINARADVLNKVSDTINSAVATVNSELTKTNGQVTNLNTSLADMVSDGKLTAVEKKSVSKEWETIKSELSTVKAQGAKYGVNVTNYQNVYNTLSSYITPILSSLTTTSTIDPTTFKNNFKNYYDAKLVVLNSTSDAIKADVVTVNTALDNAKKQVDASEALLADMAKSGKLTPVEKKTVSKEWEAIKSELATLKTQATRYGVSTANYQTQYTNLSNYVTPLLADLTTTSDVNAVTLKTNFKNYYDAKLALLNEVSNAIQTNVGNVDNKVDNLGQYVAYAWSADGKDRFTKKFAPNLFTDNSGFSIEQNNVFTPNGVRVATRYALIPLPNTLVGKTVTFSAYIKNLDEVKTDGCSIGFADYNNANANTQIANRLFVEDNRVVFTGKLPEGYSAIIIYANTGGYPTSSNSIQVYNYKVEENAEATVYSPSMSLDYDNAVPRYIGRCIKDSNVYTEYSWEVNPDRRPWVAYAQDEYGKDFSLYPYGENFARNLNDGAFTGGVTSTSTGSVTITKSSERSLDVAFTRNNNGTPYVMLGEITQYTGNGFILSAYVTLTSSADASLSDGTVILGIRGNGNSSNIAVRLPLNTRTLISQVFPLPYLKGYKPILFNNNQTSSIRIEDIKVEKLNVTSEPTGWVPNRIYIGVPEYSYPKFSNLAKYLGTATLPYADYAKYKWTLNPDYIKAQADASSSDIADMAKDNKLTPVEKKRLKKEQSDITVEFAKLKAQGTKYSVNTSTIQAKFDAVNNFINPLLSKMEETSDVNGETLRTTFSQYYAEATSVAQLVSDAIQKNVEAADSTANTAKSNAETANRAISDMANDNLVTPIEKQTLADIWDRMKREYPSMIAQAGKYGLNSEQTAYSNAYTTLNTYLNTTTKVFASMSSNTSVDGAKLQDLVNTYYVTQLAITNRVSDIIQGNVDNIKVGSRNYLYGTYTGKSANANNTSGFIVFDPYSTFNNKMLSTIGLAPGDTVTVSFDYSLSKYNETAITKGQIKTEWMGSAYLGILGGTINLSDKGRYEATTTLTASTAQATTVRIRVDNTVATINVSNMKLEKGNKATDWMYSPEDISDGIANAKKSGDDANNLLDVILKDSTINPSEKRTLQTEWQTIQAELPTLKSQGSMYNINVTNLQSQYDALNTYLNTTIRVFADMSVSTTNINVTDFRNKFSNYYKAKLDILGAIDNFLKNNVDSLGQYVAYAWSADGSSGFTKTNIGQGNLLWESGDFAGNLNNIETNPAYVTLVNNSVIRFSKTTVNGQHLRFKVVNGKYTLKQGVDYRLTMQVRSSVAQSMFVSGFLTGIGLNAFSNNFNLTTSWQTVKIAIKPDKDYDIDSVFFSTSSLNDNSYLDIQWMTLYESSEALNWYTPSTLIDADAAIPSHIGRSVKDSNNYKDYVWEVNPARGPWTAYAQDEFGKDFSTVPYGENLLNNSGFTSNYGWSGQTSANTSQSYLELKSTTTSSNRSFISQNLTTLDPHQHFSISGYVYFLSDAKNIAGSTLFLRGFYTTGSIFDIGIIDLRNLEIGKWNYVKLDNISPKQALDPSRGVQFTLAIAGEFTGTVRFNRPKLELGRKATPWTPSPYDVSNEDVSFTSLDTVPKYIGTGPLPSDDASKFKWDLNPAYVQAQSDKATNDVKDDMNGQIGSMQGDLSALGTSTEELNSQLADLNSRFSTFTTGTAQGTFNQAIGSLENRLTGVETTLDDKSFKLNFYDRHFIVGYEGILFDGGNSSTKMLLTESGLYFGKGYKVTEYQKDGNGNIKDIGVTLPKPGDLENQAVAYFSNENFYIKRGAIVSDLQIGRHKFTAQGDNLFLNYVGEIN